MNPSFTRQFAVLSLLLVLIACSGRENPIGVDEKLHQNASHIVSVSPNPAHTTANIEIFISFSSFIKLYIQNPVGLTLRTLIADSVSAGNFTQEWDLTTEGGKTLRHGLYFVTLEIPDLDYRQSRVLEIY